MNQKKEFKKIAKKIKHAPDSDDVFPIIRNTIRELVNNNTRDAELQLWIHFIREELRKMFYSAQDYIELNNLKRGVEFTENFNETMKSAVCQYTFN